MKKTGARRLCVALACVLLTCVSGCIPSGGSSSSEKEGASACSEHEPLISVDPDVVDKPVIYLYPPQDLTVTVSLNFDGELTCTYPAAPQGVWRVMAHPDGTLTDPDSGLTYGYLFWEGQTRADMDFTEGFVVKGADTAAFLDEKLSLLGLNARERTDFVTYWLPRMQKNAYNLISFQRESYEAMARLTIDPQPDSLLRVFMAYRPLEHPVDVPEQELESFTRSGFTAVEWGGTEIRN